MIGAPVSKPSQRVVEAIRPQLDATVRAAALPWWIPLRVALWLAPILAQWVIELLAATYGTQASEMLARWRAPLADLLKTDVMKAYDLVLDVCRMPLTTMDAAVCQGMRGRMKAPESVFRG